MMLTSRSRPPVHLPEPLSAPCSRLQKLPDELLLSIARRLINNSDLRQLSLVNRKLRHVAQEAFVKELSLPSHGIRDLIRTLFDRPDLCDKIVNVDLGNFLLTGCPGQTLEIEKWSHFGQCRELVDIKYAGLFDTIAGTTEVEETSLWPRTHRFFLNMLILLCPNLKELSISLPGSGREQPPRVLENEPHELLSLFPDFSIKLLGLRLQALTILETDTHNFVRTPNVTLSPLSQLMQLRIPSNTLSYMTYLDRKTDYIRQALPSNLQYLQLVPCNRYVLFCFPDLAAACVDEAFPKLRQIDLHFKACLRESLALIAQGRDILQSLRGVVAILTRSKGISIRAYNGSGALTGDLMEELDAWSLLSDFERWYPSKKDEEYSSIVARTSQGVPRRRSKEEVRAFIRPNTPSTKKRIFLFKPDVYFDTKFLSFAVDTDELPKVDVPKFSSYFDAWLSSLHGYPQLGANQALHIGPMHLDLQPLKAQPATALRTIPDFTYACQNYDECTFPKFDANEWVGIQFFEHVDSGPSKKGKTSPLESEGNHKRKHRAAYAANRITSRTRRVKTKLSYGE
ncbi:hypothetical protein N0V90_010842 [Kalmusia sp. IMI 367209]|nr:hypothetical protein N0V90_010842 [Kalmusia sp. IMI 367209]